MRPSSLPRDELLLEEVDSPLRVEVLLDEDLTLLLEDVLRVEDELADDLPLRVAGLELPDDEERTAELLLLEEVGLVVVCPDLTELLLELCEEDSLLLTLELLSERPEPELLLLTEEAGVSLLRE